MGLERYVTRRNTAFFSALVLFGSWAGVRYRQEQIRKNNVGTFHVEPHRSGGGI